jgi:hypothetical protein
MQVLTSLLHCAAVLDVQDPGPSPGQAPNGDQVLLLAEPVARANSFVGTEEYLAPEVSSLQEPVRVEYRRVLAEPPLCIDSYVDG